MKPKPTVLFHFTKSLDSLKSILCSGFWPKYCAEEFSLYDTNYDTIAYPMVCFCDIPLSRLRDHTERYGSYGIGMTKFWAWEKGINPVQYVSNRSNIYGSISRLIRNHTSPHQYYAGSETDAITLLSMIKPMESRIAPDKDFYQECEWRYVPPHGKCPPWITEEALTNSVVLQQLNEQTKFHYSLTFSPADIKYLFVNKVAEIPELVSFLQSSPQAEFSLKENQILMSRIISLEDIRGDL